MFFLFKEYVYLKKYFKRSREYDLFKFNYEHNFSFSKFSITGDQRWNDSFDNLDSSFTGLISDKEQELKLDLDHLMMTLVFIVVQHFFLMIIYISTSVAE